MSQFAGFAKSVLLIDFESTGFVKNSTGDIIDSGEPTQLGAVLLDARSLQEVSHFSSDIQADPAKLDAWVQAHTDITPERVIRAPSRAEVAKRLVEQFAPESVFLASWNIHYDRGWLDVLLRSIDRRESLFDYHHIDVWSLAYHYLCSHGRSDVIRSEETFALFGQSARAAHNALDDCRRTAEVLRAIVFDKGIKP
ncbi:MAG: 3'-5' exonuclease [Candidatus Saccharibacteria bacterium]